MTEAKSVKKMEELESPSPLTKRPTPTSSNLLTWRNLELFINTVNHCLIAISCFYMMYLCMIGGIWTHISVHAWLSMIGYQILMAEGILVMYQHNSYTYTIETRAKKSKIHWVMLALGSIFAIAGTAWEYVWRAQNNRNHFGRRHMTWGLVSLFLLAPTIVAGIAAFFPQGLKKYLKPLLSKFTHNCFAVAAFVSGMVSIALALIDLRWAKNKDPGYLGMTTVWCLGIITVICLLGPMKTFILHIKSFFNW